MSEQQRVTAKAATNERTPAWVWVVLAIWSLMLVVFLLISFGPRA
jgi:bacteriorhodopsin